MSEHMDFTADYEIRISTTAYVKAERFGEAIDKAMDIVNDSDGHEKTWSYEIVQDNTDLRAQHNELLATCSEALRELNGVKPPEAESDAVRLFRARERLRNAIAEKTSEQPPAGTD
ncbi:hypothetical protein LCGC14_1022270 [marine sediment metagenome]|uniref:Uncharacterized protein n=1 Tax=marine sediment metagenome TaxID=412755 RepID=A0A0F9MX84_9ZZZZ